MGSSEQRPENVVGVESSSVASRLPTANMVLTRTPFGPPMRDHFQFDPGYTPVNHGSYGTWPKHIREVHQRLEQDLEARPDWYINYEFPKRLHEARLAVAELVKADVDNLVFVPNATTAYNTVLRAPRWEAGDEILYFDIVYGSLQKTIKYLEETTPLRSTRINVNFPAPDDEIVEQLAKAIQDCKDRGKVPRMAVFDTIVSMPGFRLPFERLVKTCKEYDVLSLVDGAHGIGQIPLDLNALDADFFLSNLHKWLFVPRGCALLHVPRRNQAMIRTTLPTSHSFRPIDGPSAGDGPKALPPFVELFEFLGTAATQNYLTVPAALRFRRNVCGGEDAIREYCFNLAREGGRRAAEILGTEEMDVPGSCMRECVFSNIRLPIQIGLEDGQVRPEYAGAAREFIFHESTSTHDMYLQTVPFNGWFWLRISAQVYLDVQDFERAAYAAKQVCEIIRSGQYQKGGFCARCVDEKNNDQ